MNFYTFYDQQTGEIRGHAYLHEDLIDMNCPAGQGWIEGTIDADLFTIQDGQAVPIPDSTLDAAALEQAWQDFRMMRDSYFSRSDWVVTRATEQGTAVPEEWKAYRQALRDLPQTFTDPRNVVWPTPPK